MGAARKVAKKAARKAVKKTARKAVGEAVRETTASIVDASAQKEELCRRVAAGSTLVALCREPHLPDRDTVWRWCREDAAFRKALREARSEQAWCWAEEMVGIADETAVALEDGSASTRVQAEKLRIETRRWLAAKLHPRQFGDKPKAASERKAARGEETQTRFRFTGEDEAAVRRIAAKRDELVGTTPSIVEGEASA